MCRFNWFIKLAVVIALSSMTVFADQIILKSGDKLSGKVIKQDNEKIVLQTDFAGVITILKSTVEKVSLEESIVKTSAVSENKEEAKETEIAGKTEDSAKTSENETADSKTEEKTVADSTAAANPNAASAKRQSPGFTTGWDGAANLGFSFTAGNARTATFTSGIRAERSSEKDKWTVYLNSLWNRNRVAGVNLTTSNAIWGGLRYDRNLTKKFFVYGAYDFERDIPQLLNFRSVAGGGAGYHVIKNDRAELDVFSGLAWNRSWFVGPNTSAAEFVVGDTFKYKINERMKFQQGFTFYPNLSDSGEYRFIWDSTLSADVTKRLGWFVTIGDRFNSAPVFGAQKNDFLLATGLKWSFGKTK